MRIEIDLNSEEAIYIQIRNQVVLGVATSRLREGDSLPSVRQLAGTIGINIVSLDHDRIRAVQEVRERMTMILATARCKNISCEEVHALVDEIYEDYC